MEASPVILTLERYWTEEKERALIAFFSSKSDLLHLTTFHPRKVAFFVNLLSGGATFVGNRCSTMAAASDMQWRLATEVELASVSGLCVTNESAVGPNMK